MTRISPQFEKTRKVSGPRALQPSQVISFSACLKVSLDVYTISFLGVWFLMYIKCICNSGVCFALVTLPKEKVVGWQKTWLWWLMSQLMRRKARWFLWFVTCLNITSLLLKIGFNFWISNLFNFSSSTTGIYVYSCPEKNWGFLFVNGVWNRTGLGLAG